MDITVSQQVLRSHPLYKSSIPTLSLSTGTSIEEEVFDASAHDNHPGGDLLHKGTGFQMDWVSKEDWFQMDPSAMELNWMSPTNGPELLE